MLKLERIYKSRDINIRMRRRDRFLNRIFWQAFFIALGIHLFGFIFFKIQIFLSNPTPRIAPINAQADLDASRDLFNLQVAAENIPRNYPMEPQKSQPKMPQMHMPPLIRQHEYVQENGLQKIDPFKELEKQFILIPEGQLTLDYYPSFEIVFLGPLAERSISCISNKNCHLEGNKVKIELLESDPFPFQEPLSATYAVRLNEENGEIFWIELMQSSGIKNLDHLGEKIVKDIQVSHDPTLFVSAGEVEIHFKNSIK